MSRDNDDLIPNSTGGYTKPTPVSSYSKGRGASRDPKKCSHPNDRGRNCEFCGKYVRGDDMG